MNEKEKEALERWRQKEHSELIGGIDAATLAYAYLSEHPADDDEPVTEMWLSSVGFKWYGPDMSLMLDDTIQAWLGDDGNDEWQVNGRIVPAKKTRGDVRRLCAALGIELKGTT